MADFVQEIVGDIFFIEGQRRGRYPFSHSLLVKDYLCDSGISSGYIRKLKRKHPINHVLLSHWHEDHIAGNRLLPEATFYCHEKDIHILEDVRKMYDYYSIDKNPTQIELFDTILSSLRLQDTNIDVIIKDGDKIKIDENHEFEVIHTPGHTAGHCCFYETNHKVAFLADIDLSNFGPWYAGSDSNLEDFEDSIKKMMMFDQDIVVTSHKGLISGNANIKKALKDYLNVIYARDDKILEELSESSPTQISDLENKNLIYKYYTEYDIYEKMAEKIMIGYHLNKLLKMGKIEKKDNKGFILN